MVTLIKNKSYLALEKLVFKTKSDPIKLKEQDSLDPETISKAFNKDATSKLENITSVSKGMYPKNKNDRFAYWKKQVDVQSLPDSVKELYWEEYEKMHPDGKVGAKRDFVDLPLKEMSYITSKSEQEFFLREKLSVVPAWAKQELNNILAQLSTTVANSNYSKAQKVYTQNLDDRMSTFMLKSKLDPDIPVDSHVNDVMKLEQLNLMDISKVENGRVGVYTYENKFIPSVNITNRQDVYNQEDFSAPSLEEQSLVRKLAPPIILKSIEGNLISSRNKIRSQEQTGESIAEDLLLKGDFVMEDWNTAFAMSPTKTLTENIANGIRGEMKAGRVKTDKQLAQTIYKAIVQYKDILPESK